MNIVNTPHKMIDASRLLLGRYPEPVKTEYQHGWNDALYAAYEVETGITLFEEKKDNVESE